MENVYSRKKSVLTCSKSDEAAAVFTTPSLRLARTGAPKPIEESCRLGEKTK